MNLDEFRQYLLIDKNDLDTEVSRHPSLFFEVGEAYTQAAAERDALKEMLATIDAQLDNMVREELEGEKFTESMVRSRVQLHPNHATAFQAHLDAKLLADKLAALKEAFHARSYMLRELSGLFISNYFEHSSVQNTPVTDNATYRRTRQRLAEARERRE